MLCPRRLKQSVIGLLRKVTMNFNEIVSGSFLGDHFVSDLVRRHKSRLLNERAGGVDLRRHNRFASYVVAQSNDFRGTLHIDSGRDSTGKQELKHQELIRNSRQGKLNMAVDQTRNQVTMTAIYRVAIVRSFQIGSWCDLRDPPVTNYDRPVGQHLLLVHGYNRHVDERRAAGRWLRGRSGIEK